MSFNTCANCGKEGSDVTNTCNKCKEVMYCNASCKKKHRTKHKKRCERRVAELHDEKLFKQPPPKEDCPICFLRLPSLGAGSTYMSCCGKVICCACVHAFQFRAFKAKKKEKNICPFCRSPPPTTAKDIVQRNRKRMDVNDPVAISSLGAFYARGRYGLPQNIVKALELWHQAGELGHSGAYYNIGVAYQLGDGVEVDVKKAWHYYELAAMGGVVEARNNLGNFEGEAGNKSRALKHFMIAVEGGNKTSLETIKALYLNGYATKDDYTKSLRAYQAYLDEVKSEQRDEAAAVNEGWKYY